jgi:HSP20 family protein
LLINQWLIVSEDRRKQIRDMLDEVDRYFEDFGKSLEEAVRSGFASTGSFSKPVVTGMAFTMGAGGRPTVAFFGDNPLSRDGRRSPIHEQLIDDEGGTLRVLIELPGMDKQDIQVSAVENRLLLQAEHDERRYKAEIGLQREIDAESGTATYSNGLLDIVFKQRDKTNKGYRRVNVV